MSCAMEMTKKKELVTLMPLQTEFFFSSSSFLRHLRNANVEQISLPLVSFLSGALHFCTYQKRHHKKIIAPAKYLQGALALPALTQQYGFSSTRFIGMGLEFSEFVCVQCVERPQLVKLH